MYIMSHETSYKNYGLGVHVIRTCDFYEAPPIQDSWTFQTKKQWSSCPWNSNESCNKMTYTSQQNMCETLLKDHIVPHMLK
jgi:hypothetical protein